MTESPPIPSNDPVALTDDQLIGACASLQAILIGLDQALGNTVTINGIAQYVCNRAEGADKRVVWNKFVAQLRDAYWMIAELDDHG